MQCELFIDDEPFSFEMNGNFSYGENKVLFDPKGLLETVTWKEAGYTIIDLFSDKEKKVLELNILQIINKIFAQVDLAPLSKLRNYHHRVISPELHQRVISYTRFLTADDFQIDLDELSHRISRVLGKEVGIKNPLLDEEIIILRISRPKSLDINPLHRDGYLDIWANTINVWIPIAGCNTKSSLPVIPGSHYWNEKHVLKTPPKDAVINGNVYHVPGIIGGPEVSIKAIRPNPDRNQALIFTPFLVHGAAINQNQDTTRMSLEFRLCTQDQ